MANQIIIDIGALPNDGTGDPLRTAFNYVNENFSNVWATGVANSNIAFSGNRILTTNTNGDLILAPNGIGKVQANVDIVPAINYAQNLGSLTKQWNTVYARNLNIGGNVTFANLDLTGDLSVGGNVTVTGNIIEMGNIVTDAKTIQLANTAGTANAANGSGITVGANDNIATMLYSSTSNVWTTNIGISAVGNISAPYFIGNGSQLTGITSYSNANAVAYGQAGWAGNIIPSGNAVYSLGNATNQWNDLYVSNATIYMNNVPISLTSGNVLTVNGADVVTTAANGESSIGNLNILGTTIEIAAGAPETLINISPDAEGWAFLQLPNDATANTANTRVVNAAGNVTIETGDFSTGGSNVSTWTFDNTGSLMLPGNAGANNASISSIENGSIVKLNSQANGYVGITGFGSAGNNVAAITAVGLDGETDRVIISVYNPNIDDGEAWTFNNAGDFTTAGGNIFFGTQADDAVIVPGGNGVKIASDRSDLTTGYVNVTSSGITIDALGSSTSDITIRAGDDVTIRGGDKVSAPQQRGGDITIAPGTGGSDGGAGAGDGGYVEIVGGDGGAADNGGAGSGGEVRLVGGYGGAGNIANELNAGDGGMVVILGGTGGDNGGDGAFNAPGGNVEIYGGQGSIDNANNRPGGPAGHVFLRGGNWGFNFVESGNVHVETYNGNDFLNWKFDNQGRTYFPGLSTARGDTTGGTISGFTLRIGDGTNEAVITTPDGDANTVSDSQRIVINPGKGADLTSGEGGDIYLWAGRGGSGDGANAVSAGSGGDIKIRGGQGGGVNGDGGYIRMEAGDGATGSLGDSGAAGYIEITGGTSGVGRNGGYVRILGGQGDVNGGDANITAGVGVSGTGGTVNITGGTSGNGLSDYGNVNITSGASTWRFDNTGNLLLPQGGVVYETNIPFGGLSGKTIALAPYGGTSADQQLLVYPTAGADANHLHLTSGNLYNTELFLGNDDLYVKLGNTGNVVINSNDGTGNSAQWTFGTDGNLTVPGNTIVSTANATGGAGGKSISITAGASDTVTWNSNPGGNVNITGGYGSFGDGGGGPGGQVNIIGGGSSDSHAGNVTINSGSSTWTFDYTGSFVFPGGGVTMDGQNNALLTSGLANVTIGTFVQGADGGVSWEYQGDGGNANTSYGAVGLDTAGTANTANLQFKVQLVSDQGNVSTNKEWIFNTAGNLTAPGSIITSTGSGGNISGANVITANVFSASGNITGANLIATANVLSNGYARLTGGFDESQASTAGLYLGYAGGTPRIMFGTGNTSQTLEIDNDGGTLRFYKPGTTLASLNTSGDFSVAGNVSGNVSGYAIGYRDIPQVSFTGNATIATTDAGKHYYSTQSSNYTLTIANNASQGFQVGSAITIVNQGTGNITVAQGSGVTLYLAGNATSGNRTVSTFGMATLVKVATNTWFINGTGVS